MHSFLYSTKEKNILWDMNVVEQVVYYLYLLELKSWSFGQWVELDACPVLCWDLREPSTQKLRVTGEYLLSTIFILLLIAHAWFYHDLSSSQLSPLFSSKRWVYSLSKFYIFWSFKKKFICSRLGNLNLFSLKRKDEEWNISLASPVIFWYYI